ncbi:uncharacterized protein PAC_07521 [Phialocephala subalpina]|uniref:Heterokaryon incompatibility domain-containing protein n=1 Tax=Phialocephala subalpina TaxID=576137 RepID=A0A1L7WXY1_9HELO|nr:uncharacterized protein PAC_07521 [Phialocephala subalpina]
MISFTEEATETLLASIYNPQSDVYHDLHPREIRLLKLLKGRWSDKICCQLHHVSLANRPSYKALSYAWGSPRATRPIVVNGYQHAVTVNLESALRRLRRIDGDLTLWVDALCINQSNNPERTKQVNLMHDIFSSTEEVIVYLGEVPQHGSMSSNGPISESTTTFHCNENDGENLEVFRNRCRAKKPSKGANGSRAGTSFGVARDFIPRNEGFPAVREYPMPSAGAVYECV